jgi:FemAB-related protein (PEP-CTERM system-associated)
VSNSFLIRESTPKDQTLWEDFVLAHPNGYLFHRWGWINVLKDSFGQVNKSLMAFEGTTLVGILPLFEVKTRLFGHSLVSVPFGHYAGALTLNSDAAKALVEAAGSLGEALKVGHVELRQIEQSQSEWPKNDALYVTFRKAISLDPEENLAQIPRKQRAMVRKGIKADLKAGPGTLEEFHELYSENMHRHGSPTYSLKYFESLKREFGNDCDVWVVRSSGGEPLTGVLSLYYKNEAYPIYAGDTLGSRQFASNDYKYWTLMTHAAQRGCEIFNFGRSKVNTGSFDFKHNWGFTSTPLVYEYKLVERVSIPQNNPSNPKYKALISVWRKLPRSVVDKLGPIIVKGLG